MVEADLLYPLFLDSFALADDLVLKTVRRCDSSVHVVIIHDNYSRALDCELCVALRAVRQ